MTWLTETPWWLPTLLILAGAFLFIVANNRKNSNARLGGVAVVALGLLLALLSYFLESDREVVERRTNELISAVVRADAQRIGPYLDPQIAIGPWAGRDAVAKAAKSVSDSFGLQSAGATSIDVKVHGGDEALVNMSVAGSSKDGPIPISVWQLTWNKQGKQWFLKEVVCNGIVGDSGHSIGIDDMIRHFGLK